MYIYIYTLYIYIDVKLNIKSQEHVLTSWARKQSVVNITSANLSTHWLKQLLHQRIDKRWLHVVYHGPDECSECNGDHESPDELPRVTVTTWLSSNWRWWCQGRKRSWQTTVGQHAAIVLPVKHNKHSQMFTRTLLFLDNNGISWTVSAPDKVTAVPVRWNGNFQTPISVPANDVTHCRILPTDKTTRWLV